MNIPSPGHAKCIYCCPLILPIDSKPSPATGARARPWGTSTTKKPARTKDVEEECTPCQNVGQKSALGLMTSNLVETQLPLPWVA